MEAWAGKPGDSTDGVAVVRLAGSGDAALLRQALTSYGHDLDSELPRRLLAWLLLHRHSRLPCYLDRLAAPPAPTLDALADRWFGY